MTQLSTDQMAKANTLLSKGWSRNRGLWCFGEDTACAFTLEAAWSRQCGHEKHAVERAKAEAVMASIR